MSHHELILLIAIELLVYSILCALILIKVPSRHILEPIKLYIIIGVASTVPYSIAVCADIGFASSLVVSRMGVMEYYKTLSIYMFYHIIATMLVVVGYRIVSGRQCKEPLLGYNKANAIAGRLSLVAILLGLSMVVIFIYLSGGIIHFIDNIHRRSELYSGRGYIITAIDLSIIGYASWLYYKPPHPGRNMMLRIVVAIVVISVITILGGRKRSLILIILTLAILLEMRIVRIGIRNTAIGVIVIIIYFTVVPLIRSEGKIWQYLDKPTDITGDILEKSESIISQTSYMDIYIFIIDRFQNEELWLGKTYLDLATAWIPLAYEHNKPPIDDGIYIRNMAEGYSVQPGMSRRGLIMSSWPPETFGTMYMNFGIVGVIGGMLLLGMIYGYANRMYEKKRNLFWLYISIYGVANFQLSNVRIVQTAITVVILAMWVLVVELLSRGKHQYINGGQSEKR